MVAPLAACKAVAQDRAEQSHVSYEPVQCLWYEIGPSLTTLQQIETLVRELSTLAPWWRGWSQALAEADILAFERSEGIELWPDHRAILMRVGEPAPLPTHPGGALLPLAEARDATCVADVLGPLASPFASTGDAPIELAWDDERDDFEDPLWLAGCLPLAGAGCDVVDVLVITGAERGMVWTATPTGEPQLHPSGLEFGPWYLAELERGLEPLRRRAEREAELDARLARNPSDHGAAALLGSALVHRDPERAGPLLARAWDHVEDPVAASPVLARALVEFDLARGHFDRIAGLDRHPSPQVRTLAAIGAIRAGADARGLAELETIAVPAALQSLAREHEALARAHLGDLDGALASLRRAPPSRRIVELRAAILVARGEPEAAARERARIQPRRRARPRPPALIDRLSPLAP